MQLNQTLIKKFVYNGEVREYCPHSIHCECIAKTHNRSSATMLAGSYFETLCLGSGIKGQKTDDMPRKRLTKKQIANGQTIGDKTVDQVRIDEQVLRFRHMAAEAQLSIQPEVNTQVGIFKRWSRNDNIILKGELDLFPTPIMLTTGEMKIACIDLKLTKKFTDWGEFCWLTPQALDVTQGLMYHELMRDIDMELNVSLDPETKLLYLYKDGIRKQLEKNDMMFIYWVFEYAAELRTKMIAVKWTPERRAELNESIRKTIEEINRCERRGWSDTRPNEKNCQGCPVIECPLKVTKSVTQFNQQEDI